MTAALALAALLALDAPASPPPQHVVPGGEARALTMAFRIATVQNSVIGLLSGTTVTIGDLPACYRVRIRPDADPDKTTTLRMGKSSDTPGTCGDEAAPEIVLPGPEAEGIARLLVAWSSETLDGSPPLDDLVNATFSVVSTTRLDADPPLVMIELHTGSGSAGNCPLVYSYDAASGKISRLARIC